MVRVADSCLSLLSSHLSPWLLFHAWLMEDSFECRYFPLPCLKFIPPLCFVWQLIFFLPFLGNSKTKSCFLSCFVFSCCFSFFTEPPLPRRRPKSDICRPTLGYYSSSIMGQTMAHLLSMVLRDCMESDGYHPRLLGCSSR